MSPHLLNRGVVANGRKLRHVPRNFNLTFRVRAVSEPLQNTMVLADSDLCGGSSLLGR